MTILSIKYNLTVHVSQQPQQTNSYKIHSQKTGKIILSDIFKKPQWLPVYKTPVMWFSTVSVLPSWTILAQRQTPYSLYLTIRKSWVKNKSSSFVSDNHQISASQEELDSLKFQLKSLEDCEEANIKVIQLETKLSKLENTVNAKDTVESKGLIVEQMKKERTELETQLEAVEKNFKTQNKTLKDKDKEIHDLKKEVIQINDNLKHILKNFPPWIKIVAYLLYRFKMIYQYI